MRAVQLVFVFVLTVTGIYASASRVLATEDPSPPQWYLADGGAITEEDVVWMLAAHRQAVENDTSSKIEDYWQPLKGAYLPGANFAVLLRKAEER